MIETPSWRYTPALAEKIELKWQKKWAEEGCFYAANAEGTLTDGQGRLAGERKPYTVLDMFPFPSGKGLHVGHPLGYIATDFVSRFKRMQGYNVLHALGFDAFGLPAEQFAIATGQHPRKTTEENIANMRRQLSRLGLSFDPRRSFATTDPEYMKWTQWIFARLYSSYYDPDFRRPDGKKGCARPIKELVKEFESGKRKTEKPWEEMSEREKSELLNSFRLAYISDSFVNWCPGLGTVLANEEVTREGKSERGNWPVYRKKLRQWSMRITAYADRLLEDLDGLDWPETVKAMQKNWIGKCEGLKVALEVAGKGVEAFLPSPALFSHPSFLVLPSSMAPQLPKEWPEGTKESWKQGATSPRALFSAFKSSHPYPLAHSMDGIFSGIFSNVAGKNVPVFISDYVSEPHLGLEGEEDAKFARIHSIDQNPLPAAFDSQEEAIKRAEEGGLGQREERYRLRDWLFSRQRYWGEPFPIVYSEDGTEHLLPDSFLPVNLPSLPDYKPKSFDPEDSSSLPVAPLARNGDWVEVELDLGDGLKKYKRETNTMPNWAGSCWYYLRYLSPRDDNHFVNPEEDRYFLSPFHNKESDELGGVDLYVGGVEHAVLHLLYARFWHKVLYDLGYLSSREPFYKLFNQGYVQAYAYTDSRGQYVPASQVECRFEGGEEAFYFEGKKVNREFGKMGKSLKNMVTPDEMYEAYGADTFRVYEMSMGPLSESRPWNLKDVAGSQRFLQRLWRNIVSEDTGEACVSEEMDAKTRKLLNRTIKGVSEDMEEMRPNTAIAKLIVLNNHLTSLPACPREAAEGMVKMLFPIAPHICEELWERLGHTSTLSFAPWPEAGESAEEETVAVVQVDGKVRCRLSVPAGIGERDLERLALSQEAVKQWLGGQEPLKVVCKPPKIVSLVSRKGGKEK
ncbi:MAG: leucine--tRNA ligase [Aeriscardovia sp.]|nr:leucine--tRNA ligase [Aeriscardovia sp.]